MVLEQQFTCFSQQKVPVCRQHRRGIPPSSITRHVSRQHAETLTPIQRTHLLAQVADRWPLLEPSAIQNPGSTCRALPTLTIDGFRCAVDGCLRGNDSISRSRQVMLRYRNRVHGQHHRSKTTGVDSAQEPKFVRWFVVRTSTVPETTTQDWQRPEADLDERLFKESLDEDVASFKTLAAPESHVKETPRLRRTGFHHYLQDCDKAELTLTAGSPAPTASGLAFEQAGLERRLQGLHDRAVCLMAKWNRWANLNDPACQLSRGEARILASFECEQ